MTWARLAGDVAAMLAAGSAFIALAQPRTSRAVGETGQVSFSRTSGWQRVGLVAAAIGGLLAFAAAVYDIAHL
jgi:hypothetical protein